MYANQLTDVDSGEVGYESTITDTGIGDELDPHVVERGEDGVWSVGGGTTVPAQQRRTLTTTVTNLSQSQ